MIINNFRKKIQFNTAILFFILSTVIFFLGCESDKKSNITKKSDENSNNLKKNES